MRLGALVVAFTFVLIGCGSDAAVGGQTGSPDAPTTILASSSTTIVASDSSVSTMATATTQRPQAPKPILRPDGIADIRFGTPYDEARDRLIAMLGPPSLESIGIGYCESWLRFRTLVVSFNASRSDESAGRPVLRRFESYFDDSSGGSIFQTERGIGVGASVADVRVAYPEPTAVVTDGETMYESADGYLAFIGAPRVTIVSSSRRNFDVIRCESVH